jgi:hypothetical protein
VPRGELPRVRLGDELVGQRVLARRVLDGERHVVGAGLVLALVFDADDVAEVVVLVLDRGALADRLVGAEPAVVDPVQLRGDREVERPAPVAGPRVEICGRPAIRWKSSPTVVQPRFRPTTYQEPGGGRNVG